MTGSILYKDSKNSYISFFGTSVNMEAGAAGPIDVQEDREIVVQKEVSICIVMAVKT